MRPAARLRELLARPGLTLLPGAYDALTAKLVDLAGFEAVYFSGAGVAYTQLAMPDIGLVSLSEMAQRVATVAAAADLPVVADADTGYGNALNVQRAVREYERAGAAAIQIEDQEFPKRCGHLEGTRLIDAEEMAGKIRAARDASAEIVIVARTDAASTHGSDEVVRRSRLYVDAGADVIFADAVTNVDELKALPALISRPMMVNIVEGGRTPPLPAADLEAFGYRLAIYPNSLVRLMARSGLELLRELRARGTTAGWAGRMATFGELNELLGTADLLLSAGRYDAGSPEPLA